MRLKQFDLHLHSYYSDGHDSLKKLVKRAKKAGFSLISITDHNTLEHLENCARIAKDLKINILPGAEIGVTINGKDLHLLAFGFEKNNSGIKKLFNYLKRKRKKEIEKITLRLRKNNFLITLDEINGIRADYPGLAHIVRIMLKKPAIKKRIKKEVGSSNVYSIINHYFSKGKLAYVQEKFPSAKTVIKTIKKAGGIVSLAHPGFHLSFSEDKIIQKLKKSGLDCLEVFTPKHNWEQTIHYELLSRKLNLVITAGSDYHFIEHKTLIPLASPLGFQKIPPGVYDDFLKYLKKKTDYKFTK